MLAHGLMIQMIVKESQGDPEAVGRNVLAFRKKRAMDEY